MSIIFNPFFNSGLGKNMINYTTSTRIFIQYNMLTFFNGIRSGRKTAIFSKIVHKLRSNKSHRAIRWRRIRWCHQIFDKIFPIKCWGIFYTKMAFFRFTSSFSGTSGCPEPSKLCLLSPLLRGWRHFLPCLQLAKRHLIGPWKSWVIFDSDFFWKS